MSTENGSKAGLKTLFKILAVADLFWAVCAATLQSLILNQAGVSIGADGTATTIAAGSTWIGTFIVAFIQGAIFLVFACIYAAIWGGAYYFLTEDAPPRAKSLLTKVFGTILILDVLWALLQGVQSAAIVAGLGTASAIHASTAVTTVAAVLAFIISSCVGLFIGTVFFTLLGAFLVVGLLVYAVITQAKSEKPTEGPTREVSVDDLAPETAEKQPLFVLRPTQTLIVRSNKGNLSGFGAVGSGRLLVGKGSEEDPTVASYAINGWGSGVGSGNAWLILTAADGTRTKLGFNYEITAE